MQIKPLFYTVALSLTSAPLATLAQGLPQSPAYKECLALSSGNPSQALVKAEEWLKIDNSIPAQHCRALALYGLKRYAEAGEALNGLHNAVAPEDVALRAFLTKQAASAWLNAGRPDAALASYDQQLNEMNSARGNNAANAKLTSELLRERAKLNITYGKTKLALRDLDHAVSLTPVNIELLLERAEAFQQVGDNSLAKADAEAVLQLDSNNAKARELLKLN